MTAAQMETWFEILQDKYNEPSFEQTELSELLTDAQIDYVMEFVTPTEGAPLGKLEKTIYDSVALQPIIKKVTVTSSAGAFITNDAIETALDTLETLTPDPIVILPLRVKPTTSGITKAARRVREMEIDEVLADTLSGTDEGWANHLERIEPVYLLTNDSSNNLGIQLYPTATFASENIDVVILRMPIPIKIETTAVDCELPAFTHRKIVAKAMSATGIITEHDALLLMEQKTNG